MMLYETLSQPMILISMLLCGFLCGFLFDLKDCVLLKIKHKNILNQIFSFFACFITLFMLFFVNLRINHGEFRFFTICVFALSFFLERFLMTNFVAIWLRECYNKMKDKINGKRKQREQK